MSALRALPEPVPAVLCGDVAISVPAAVRDKDGNLATVQAVNGRVLWSDTVCLSTAQGRAAWRVGAAAHTGVPEADLDAALLDLSAQVEDALRATKHAPAPATAEKEAIILDAAPAQIHRPLCIVEGRAYAVTWLHLDTNQQAVVVVREDGAAFSSANIADVAGPDDLGLTVLLHGETAPMPSRTWSGAGVKRYMAGDRPAAAAVYRRVRDVVDTFIAFDHSLAPQRTMCAMLTCYILASYFLDAFNVAGYLWANGQAGSGKTNMLIILTELGYLGQLVLAGGTYASLRDLADWGALLAFDEAEDIMDAKKSDPDKRSLLLAGNRRGATVTFKEPVEPRVWRTRHVHTFQPRAFSAIKRPFGPMASRSIILPMIRSAHATRDDPADHAAWPHDRRQLLDDLWALGLANLAQMREYDRRAAERATLTGRDLEPWRGILAVALWLQERHQVAGVFDTLLALSVTYQNERGHLEYDNQTRLAVETLLDLFEARGQPALLSFTTAEALAAMNRRAEAADLGSESEPYITAKKLGWLFKSLRRLAKDDDPKARGWKITRDDLLAMAGAYSVRRDSLVSPRETSRTSQTSTTSAPAAAARENTAAEAAEGSRDVANAARETSTATGQTRAAPSPEKTTATADVSDVAYVHDVLRGYSASDLLAGEL